MILKDIFALQKLYGEIKNEKMPIRTAFKLNTLASKVQTEADFYKNQITNIISEYSEKDEYGNPKSPDGGQTITIQKDKVQECNEKIKELDELEIEIKERFYLEELECLNLTPQQLTCLMSLIED